MKAVIVGYDPAITKFVIESMSLHWPDVKCLSATKGTRGLELVRGESPDVVFLDSSILNGDLAHTIQELRQFSSVPLVVLAEVGVEMDLATALDLGADDYVCMPCPQGELTARVWALLRRVGMMASADAKTPSVSVALVTVEAS